MSWLSDGGEAQQGDRANDKRHIDILVQIDQDKNGWSDGLIPT